MRKKYIISPFTHLTSYKDGDEIYIGINIKEDDLSIIEEMGFSIPLVEGECLLPSPRYGKPFFDNAEGRISIHRNEEKEIAYSYREWDFKDWHGNWHSAATYIPYKRFPRTQAPPLNIEMAIFNGDSNEKILVTAGPIIKKQENEFVLKTSMNMFLSLFNRFETFDKNLKKPVSIIKTVPWELLKPGTKANNDYEIEKILKTVKKSQQSMYKGDIDFLKKHNPSMIATGKMGFHGYIAFFYSNKNIAILESVIPGNATYIFDKNWEEFSKLSKTEVLSSRLQKDRVFHNETWKSNIEKYIG